MHVNLLVSHLFYFAYKEINISLFYHHCRDMCSDNSAFLVSEVDFLLGGGETTMVSLCHPRISFSSGLSSMDLSWLEKQSHI